MEIVFVAGATGVLGRSALRELLRRGLRVRALARSNERALEIAKAGAEPVVADLFDIPSLHRAIAGSSAILHLATRIPNTDKLRKRDSWAENDRIRSEGTHNLVEVALAACVETLIYPSVTFVYPDRRADWIDATTVAPAPVDLVKSTLVAEREVVRFASQGRRGVTLRMGPFYGPQSTQSRYIVHLARRGLLPFIARNEAYHPFIWIDDAASAVVAALEGCPSGVFDIVDDEPLTVSEIRASLAAAVGRRRLWGLPRWLLSYSMGPSLAELSSRSRRVSNARFKSVTGWAPSVASCRVGWPQIASSGG
jgi:2-alkyl-3-oxoalkanoate reductase